MSNNNLELIRQALGAAESSIKLARQLLGNLEGTGIEAKPKAKELPGVTGIFDGENMVSEDGQSFPVPANYASKSMLVVGDTLKLVDEGKEKRFKQIEHVKRHKTNGILTKKDGKWKVITPEGSYKVLPAAVAHFGADISSEVTLHLPANNLTVPYGAIEVVNKKTSSSKAEDSKDKISQPKQEEQKIKPKPQVLKKSEVKELPKNSESIKGEQEAKPLDSKISQIKKKEDAKPVETPKPLPKQEMPKQTPKETVVVKPEPLKAITIEPEPKIDKHTEAESISSANNSKSVEIEISPEEDELT